MTIKNWSRHVTDGWLYLNYWYLRIIRFQSTHWLLSLNLQSGWWVFSYLRREEKKRMLDDTFFSQALQLSCNWNKLTTADLS